jgi:CubicO group peptidase (beta-lactamase class C family)
LLCSRSLTIYLYHGPGLLFANLLLEDQLGLTGPSVPVLSGLVVVATCLAAVALFGWVEDLAARRTDLRVWPIRLGQRAAPAIAVAVGAVIVVPTFAIPLPDGSAVLDNPIPPSGQAVIARADAIEVSEGPPPPTAVSGDPFSPVDLQHALDAWRGAHVRLMAELPTDEIAVAVTRVDEPVVTATWTRTGSPTTRATGIGPLASLTKTLTGAWVAGGIRDGLIDPNAPMSEYLHEVARADEFTVEQALRHVSGLPHYGEDPRTALEAWNNDPVFFAEPGSSFGYSDLNYFLAALMMERVTGEHWEDYVATIEQAVGIDLVLDQEVRTESAPTHPLRDDYFGSRWAAGGLYATLPNAARLFATLLGDPEIVPDATRDLMTTFNLGHDTFNYGIGLVPACPCWKEEGHLKAARYGHDSDAAGYLFDAETGTVVAYFVDEWSTDPYRNLEFLSIHAALLDETGDRPLVENTGTVADS